MIDIDDIDDGFLYGGIIIGLIFVACYFIFSRPIISECEKNGGVIVKSNGDAICVDKKAIIPAKKGGAE